MTAAPRPIVLDADGRKRLQDSIDHWERLATGKRQPGETPGAFSCALCARWLRYDCDAGDDRCPIYQATGRRGCKRTPYTAAARAWERHGAESPEFRAAATVELAFLRDLLARAKAKP